MHSYSTLDKKYVIQSLRFATDWTGYEDGKLVGLIVGCSVGRRIMMPYASNITDSRRVMLFICDL